MHDSTFVFFLVVLQIAIVCCCCLWLKSHCGMAWIAIRGLYRAVVRSADADTSNLAESGYAKAASPVPPPRQPQTSAEQQQPLMVVPQMSHPYHFQPYHVYQPQLAPSLPSHDLPYPPANYPHRMGFFSPRPSAKVSPIKVTAPAAETEINPSQPHKSLPSEKHA